MENLTFKMFKKVWKAIGTDTRGGIIFDCGIAKTARLVARNIEFKGPAWFNLYFADGDEGTPLAIMTRSGGRLWRWKPDPTEWKRNCERPLQNWGKSVFE